MRETLRLSGLVASIGSVGDAYDNSLAETTIGLYKNEAVRDDTPFRRGPLNRLVGVEMLTAGWVGWYKYQPAHAPPRHTRRRANTNRPTTLQPAPHQ
ncbi:hypothetical protein MALGJ_07250 [Mycolicibacter algericus]|uniref:Transposase n=1 Tax=Mycolicibacter algericus TaxID=1288388 RepID=A0A7I9Y5S8_MYCAL|nr:hypothetical protein MALGJ_07250 [Mycolicibacter algericus]